MGRAIDNQLAESPEFIVAAQAAKLGIPQNAVALALISYAGSPTCPPASNFYDAIHIADFVGMFGANGLVGGICEPDYGIFFNSAIPLINDACDNFVDPT